ncbi:MAG TPA: hypothetical protein VI488_11475 [Candidatus Angelobacter sp.]
MHIISIWTVVEWLSLPALAVLAGILVWRRLHREFPFFFLFVLAAEIATIVRFAAKFGTPWTYFYAYWISDLVVTIFNFLAVYELYTRRLFPSFQRVRFYRYLFAAAASAAIALGWLTAMEAPDKTAAFLIEARVLNFIVAVAMGLLVSLMVFMNRVWTRFDFGIAFGLGINAATFMFVSAMWVRTHYGPSTVDRLPVVAYDISCLIWLFTFWKPERRTQFLPPEQLNPEMLHQARSWETVLKNWLTVGKSKR